jgi:hypothetical protein
LADDPNQASKDRLARNEAIFRSINERVEEVQDAESQETDFLCECGNLDCTQTIAMRKAEYEKVRRDATTFAVIPGHVLEDVESVVEETDRFTIVQKHEEERAIVEATDPRG